jgi:hypothetical protein
MDANQTGTRSSVPWNGGKLVGSRAPLYPKDIWTMRLQLPQQHRTRELALLNLGIGGESRRCNLPALNSACVRPRACSVVGSRTPASTRPSTAVNPGLGDCER